MSCLILINPKYPENLGNIIRNCAAFDLNPIYYTGTRMLNKLSVLTRTPRQFRMREYEHIEVIHDERPFLRLSDTTVPVAVEVDSTAVPIQAFTHPPEAAYVFGPEDGDIPSVIRRHCHQFVTIPTKIQCLNLATAVAIVGFHHGNQTV